MEWKCNCSSRCRGQRKIKIDIVVHSIHSRVAIYGSCIPVHIEVILTNVYLLYILKWPKYASLILAAMWRIFRGGGMVWPLVHLIEVKLTLSKCLPLSPQDEPTKINHGQAKTPWNVQGTWAMLQKRYKMAGHQSLPDGGDVENNRGSSSMCMGFRESNTGEEIPDFPHQKGCF